jgi:hypothetical protein
MLRSNEISGPRGQEAQMIVEEPRIALIGPGAIGTTIAAVLHEVGRTPLVCGRRAHPQLSLRFEEENCGAGTRRNGSGIGCHTIRPGVCGGKSDANCGYRAVAERAVSRTNGRLRATKRR